MIVLKDEQQLWVLHLHAEGVLFLVIKDYSFLFKIQLFLFFSNDGEIS